MIGDGRMRSRSLSLRPVRGADTDWLYQLMTSDAGSRWRYRGRTPNPAEFAQDLWRSVHTQFVVERAAGGPVGLVGIYNANPAAGHAHLFAVGAADAGPVVTEAAGHLVSWAFDDLDLHKIWIEAPEFNLAQFASLTDVAEVEGRLTNFDFWRGRYWDLLVLSIARQRWDERHRVTLRRRAAPLGRPGGPVAPVPSLPAIPWIEALVADRLPFDSLDAIEVLTELEEATDRPLDVGVLDGLAHLDAPAAAVEIHRRLGAPAPSTGPDGAAHDDRRPVPSGAM